MSTTPLIVHFFLRPHLRALARFADVTVVLNPDNDSYTPALDLPVRVVPISIKRPISFAEDLRTVRELIGLFRRERFDLVLAVAPKAGLLGLLAARLTGVRSRLFIFQGEVWAARTGFWRWVLKTADKVTARCATHLLAVSPSEAAFLAREGVVPAGGAVVLGSGSICGVDTSRYHPDPLLGRAVRAELGVPEQAKVVLFVGRLTENKGVFELSEAFVQAARDRSDLWLVMVGPDEENVAPRIRALLGDLRTRCRVLGFSENPQRFMAAADFLCLPSHREGFGMVIIEAAAVGIPAVAYSVPGVIDAISDGRTGTLTALRDVRLLAAAIARYADDNALRRQHGEAARRRVMVEFEQGEVVDRYVDFVRRCAEPGRAAVSRPAADPSQSSAVSQAGGAFSEFYRDR